MLRSKTYRLFIMIFFLSALIMSACKTIDYVNDTEDKHDSVLVVDTSHVVEDTVVTSVGDTVLIIADSVFIETNIVVDTIVNDDSIVEKPAENSSQKKSFIEDKIERTCSDSTIQDFKSNKIYYYGDAKVVYDDITIEAEYIEFDFDKRGLARDTMMKFIRTYGFVTQLVRINDEELFKDYNWEDKVCCN